MKKEYKDLELETVKFESEDVITASGGCELVIAPCKPLECGGLCECFSAMDCPGYCNNKK